MRVEGLGFRATVWQQGFRMGRKMDTATPNKHKHTHEHKHNHSHAYAHAHAHAAQRTTHSLHLHLQHLVRCLELACVGNTEHDRARYSLAMLKIASDNPWPCTTLPPQLNTKNCFFCALCCQCHASASSRSSTMMLEPLRILRQR